MDIEPELEMELAAILLSLMGSTLRIKVVMDTVATVETRVEMEKSKAGP